MKANGTARYILSRPLSRGQWRELETIALPYRLGAMWRMLKFGHPWPRHRKRQKAA